MIMSVAEAESVGVPAVPQSMVAGQVTLVPPFVRNNCMVQDLPLTMPAHEKVIGPVTVQVCTLPLEKSRLTAPEAARTKIFS